MSSPVTVRPAQETLSPQAKDDVLALYNQGLYLQAHAVALAHGPLEDWTGTSSRIVAARLGYNLGALRRSESWMLRAWRADPEHHEAIPYGHRALFRSRGPVLAWHSLQLHPLPDDADAELRGDWLALAARLLASLRDFGPAERLMAAAHEASPDRPWLLVEESSLLAAQDRRPEAVALLERALELRPWYRPAVQGLAYALEQQDRIDEALTLLAEATEQLESGHLVAQRTQLLLEQGRPREAHEALARYEQLTPLLEKKGKTWLRGLRADIAYRCGELEAAIDLASEASHWQQQVAENMAYDPDGARVALDVGFIRQHYRTCGPASLTMVCGFWDAQVDHEQLTEEICYDGTTNMAERRWAEGRGWTVREFTVDWPGTVALIDRGVPFTLCTVEPTSAHLQIVMGYDARRGTLLVRDPGHRHEAEFLADRAFWRYRPTGPRGMVLVPKAEAARLEGLPLRDAHLYDHLHSVERALDVHDREAAEAALAALQGLAPGHDLTLNAERTLALYDGDDERALRATDVLLRRHSGRGIYELRKLSLLDRLGRREELLTLLETASNEDDADPAFRERYACELMADARRHDQAEWLLRRALKRRPTEPVNLHTLADLRCEQRRFDEALPYYRYAACLADKTERFARSYFRCARYAGDALAGLDFLMERVARLGQRSALPVQTLVWAYAELDQDQEGLAALEDALALRPDDPELLLFAAEELARHGELDRAGELLERARGRTSPIAHLRLAALLARLGARPAEALARWREVLEASPLDVDAHAEVAALLSRLEGRAASQAHLAAAAGRFSHHLPLLRLWIRSLDDPEELAERERAIRCALAANETDPWGYRELAFCLGRQRRPEEAQEALDQAFRLEPHSCAAYGILGRLHELEGEQSQARDAFRQALLLDVDYGYGIAGLFRSCETAADRQEALDFLREELLTQRVYGDGIMAVYEEAKGHCDPMELLELLRVCHEKHGELWQSGSALVGQLADVGLLDEALQLALRASERFPLEFQVLRDVAWVRGLRNEGEEEVAALRRLLVMAPGQRSTSRILARTLLRLGRFEEARDLLAPEAARSPLDVPLQSLLASVLWRLQEREDALAIVERTARLEPRSADWERLANWALTLERPDLVPDLAREIAEAQPDQADGWLRLARALPADRLEEALGALDRAEGCDPHDVQIHDLRAELLSEAGRHDEARAACRPEAMGERIPLTLRGRGAWVEAKAGNRPGAIEQMKPLVEESPTYFWGWLRLSDWCRAEEDAEGHLYAAKALARLGPQEDLALSHLGSALRMNDDREGSLAAFRRAVELTPDSWFAATHLFDMLLEDGTPAALEEAQRVVTALEAAYPEDAEVWERGVVLGARSQATGAALAKLLRLVRIADGDPSPLRRAVGALREAGLNERTQGVLSGALAGDEPVHWDVGRQFVEGQAAQGELLACEGPLDELRSRHPEAARRGVVAYLEHLADGEHKRRLKRYVKKRRDLLRAEATTWGTVGYALQTISSSKQAVAWLSDWREREGVRPWMLLNLILSLRALGRGAAAEEAQRGALALEPDHATDYILVLAASSAALSGDADGASASLQRAEGRELNDYYAFHAGVARAALAALTLAGEEAFDVGRKELDAIRERVPGFRSDPDLLRVHAQACWRVARTRGVIGLLWFVAIWFYCVLALK